MGKDGEWCAAPLLKKVRENWGLVLSSQDRKVGNYKRMNGCGKLKPEQRRLKLESSYMDDSFITLADFITRNINR